MQLKVNTMFDLGMSLWWVNPTKGDIKYGEVVQIILEEGKNETYQVKYFLEYIDDNAVHQWSAYQDELFFTKEIAEKFVKENTNAN